MSSTSIVNSEEFELCSDNSSINEVASSQNAVGSNILLEQQLSDVLKDHQTMDNLFNHVVQVSTPNLIQSLSVKKKWSCCVHLVINVSIIIGLFLALVSLFVSITNRLILIGQCIAIAAYFIDSCIQKAILKEYTSSDVMLFRAQYELAKKAYVTLLNSFNEYCDVLTEYNPQCSGLKKVTKDIIQPQLTNTSTCCLLKLVLQSTFSLCYSVNFIISFLNKNSECTGGLKLIVIYIFQKIEPFVSNVSTIVPVVGIVCNAYILFDTIANFFEYCAASKDIDSYMAKLRHFQKDLLYISSKIRDDIQLLQSEVAGIVNKQKISLLEYQLESQNANFTDETAKQNQTFSNSLKSQKECFDHQMEALKQEFKNDLMLQKDYYEKSLNHQQRSLQDQLQMQFYQFQTIINEQQALIHELTTQLAS